MPKTVLLDDYLKGLVRHYTDPIRVITVYDADALDEAFTLLERYKSDGFYLAGYFAYELGFILESKLHTIFDEDFNQPLLQVGIFKDYSQTPPDALLKPDPAPHISLNPLWSETEYLSRFQTVMDYIESGDVYQINLTFPMTGSFKGDAVDLYAALRRRQPVHYGGVVSLENGPAVVSLSPELFFEKDGLNMSMRPMKGTVKRLPDKAADKLQLSAMQKDEKSQAENLMIVDLLRNDLSRLSVPGSVKVPELFALETYPTLHQMTSKVTSRLKEETPIKALLQSLFPCGSVTGAPKIRAMEIIRDIEATPRGAYCGALGYIDPTGQACFNVGIRTMILENGQLTYNVGSGIVRDSIGSDEYNECLLKAEVITKAAPSLIETMRQEKDGSIVLWSYHLNRLKKSASELGYNFDESRILQAIPKASERIMRLRLLLAVNGNVSCDAVPYESFDGPIKLSISKNPLDLSVQETRFKVSARNFYDGERERIKALNGTDEVLFFNPHGYLCEGSFTSLFLKEDERYFTPPLNDGLLPGVLRQKMLKTGKATERSLALKDLVGADIYVGNALRGLMKARLIDVNPL